MKERLYTIGEIFRLKLLKNYRGKPYGSKSQVAKVVRRLEYRIIKTPWGSAKALPMSAIKKYNATHTATHTSASRPDR